MMPKEYRTLMLEPQWHPIRRTIRWAKKEISLEAVITICVLWDILEPILVACPYPVAGGLWPWWRWTLLALGVAPLTVTLLACVFVGLVFMLGWFHDNPPFKVKTRYQPKDSR